MLELILKLYVMGMANDVRSPTPHLFGPPGAGKSTVVKTAADLLDVQMHTMNVSRISPLEVEGVQMPVGAAEEMKLRLLHSTFWTQLREGDIVLLDEFLRGFPEVYNALLDILTSREVGGFKLPKVFIIAASNSTIAYDKALEDRLMHITVPDPRTDKRAKKEMAERFINTLGLLPQMATSMEMQQVLDQEVFPMYTILDSFGQNRSASPATVEGRSLRNLTGQAQLRHIDSTPLRELIDMNNILCKQKKMWQFILLPDAASADEHLEKMLRKVLAAADKLTPVQLLNTQLNLQLIEMEAARKEGMVNANDADPDPFLD